MPKYLMTAILAAGLCIAPQVAQAQSAIQGRVDRLEGEMRAVQRKVFPGGQYVEPENSPSMSSSVPPGSPSGSPVSDLESRVTALESQRADMTGQIEMLQHRQQVSEDAFTAYKRTTDARLKALEDGASSVGSNTSSIDPSSSGTRGSSTTKPATTTRPVTTTTTTTTKDPGKDPGRAKRVAAVEKPPVTADPAEDMYLYGYRLWQAKLYPEAEGVFQKVVATYPKHKRASYAQNLLGRSYLEENNVRSAMQSFYDNFHNMPDGDRAPESLSYLAQTLIKIDKPVKACEVYGVLDQVYSAKLSDTIKADMLRGRAQAKCK